jgi:hypothetical protein
MPLCLNYRVQARQFEWTPRLAESYRERIIRKIQDGFSIRLPERRLLEQTAHSNRPCQLKLETDHQDIIYLFQFAFPFIMGGSQE